MGEFFDMKFFDLEGLEHRDDDPGDLAMQSSGSDMMKMAMVALRRGRLPNGKEYIAESKWNEWAGRNQLPGNRLSKDCADWKMQGLKISYIWRTALTRSINAGDFGWSFCGATYHEKKANDAHAGDVIAVGWKGFTSCGFRADYKENIAFVAMQEIVPDPGSRNFGECVHQGKI